MAGDRTQESTDTVSPNLALHADQFVHDYQVRSLLWRDQIGHVYSVRTRQSFASKGENNATDDVSSANELLLRELMPLSICDRAKETDKVVVCEGHEILFDKCRERFLAEAKSLLGLGACKGLLQVLRVFEHNGTAYQLIEKPTGQSLRHRIDDIKHGRSEKFSTRELTEILSSVLNGLQRAHSLNLLHRNINPDCIFLDDENGAKLGDYFAAGQVLRSQLQQVAVADGAKSNKVSGHAYAPVELSLARGNQGCWSDLYALGACLYEAIALTAPALATIRFEQMQSSQIDSYVPLRVILESMYPARLLEAVDWMLKANIRNRPKSVTELADFLGFELDERAARRRFSHGRAPAAAVHQADRQWRAPVVRRLWRSRKRFDASNAELKPAATSPDAIAAASPDQSPLDNFLHLEPARNHRFSPATAITLVGAVVVSASVFFFYADSPQPLTQTTASSGPVAPAMVVASEQSLEQKQNIEQPTALQPSERRAASQLREDTSLLTINNVQDDARAANDRSARSLAKKAQAQISLHGVRRDRYVARHLGEAEQAWRDGRLLVPGKGSVLRHLERVIDVDAGNVDAVAGVNHLLYHFLVELQKAETSGDAVAIRYLNRNIRRVRLRHPGSVPKSHHRFASLPAPPPPATRMAGVAAANLRPDYTE